MVCRLPVVPLLALLVALGACGSTADDARVVGGGHYTPPCLAIDPVRVDFGEQIIWADDTVAVTVSACAEAPLEIFSLTLDGDDAFTLSPDELEGASADEPVVVPAGESRTFSVTYSASEIGAAVARVRLVSNAEDSPARVVELSGAGREARCPTAVASLETVLDHGAGRLASLSSAQSTAAEEGASIVKRLWTVEQPPHSKQRFEPNAEAPHPEFLAQVVGGYRFTLEVWDSLGTRSCEPSEVTLSRVPAPEGLTIELVWSTPGDPDEADDTGSDVDLHLLHPYAVGLDVDEDGVPDGWFDNPFDTFWFNPEPDWGSHDVEVDDNPQLHADEDGAGPETLELHLPEDGLEYRVGVHYWHDHGLGESTASLRIFVDGTVLAEIAPTTLVYKDLWDVGTIRWPERTFTPTEGPDGGPAITPDYQHPFFLHE